MAELMFSVVIPTRERADTLEACIKSVLGNDYADMEVIVQDNASDVGTRQVCDRFNDPRLVYSRSDTRVSMRQNFELGMRKTTGKYVIFLGDDDALTLDCIQTLHNLLKKEPAEFISWPSDKYMWPSVCADGKGFLSVRTDKWSGGYQKLDLQDLRRKICDSDLSFSDKIGQIYVGCVARSLIERIKAVRGGDYFVHTIPDYGAAMANMFEAKSGLFVNRTLSLAGKSANSNGAAFLGDVGAKKSEAVAYLSENARDTGALGDIGSGDVRSTRYYFLSTLRSAELQLGRSFGLNKERWVNAVVSQLVDEKRNTAKAIQGLRDDFDFKDVANTMTAVADGLAKQPKTIFKGARPKNIHVRTVDAGKRDDVYVAVETFKKLTKNRSPLVPLGAVAKRMMLVQTLAAAYITNRRAKRLLKS
jgi:glycosyltransferase involved in cell wall biosynthesis